MLHTPNDGKGSRIVHLRGSEVKYCIQAFEGEQGWVDYYTSDNFENAKNVSDLSPIRGYGVVTVDYIEGGE